MSASIAYVEELMRLTEELMLANRAYRLSSEDKTLPTNISPGTAARRRWEAHKALVAHLGKKP